MLLATTNEVIRLKEEWEEIKDRLPGMDKDQVKDAREKMDALASLIQEKRKAIDILLGRVNR